MSESNESGPSAATGPSSHRYDWLTPGDVNAFFGLMLDNLTGLFLVVILISGFGFPTDFAISAMIPGTALGVLIGDLAFVYFAFRLAKK